MSSSWEPMLGRWTAAGLLDSSAAQRIRQWEGAQHSGAIPNRLAAIAFGLGGVLLIAGAFLFVSAHWDSLSTGTRFAVVLGMVAALHVGGAWSARRSPLLSTALHATGTAALGAGIFLAGQIFNMAEHWPGALLLWSVGALLGLVLLRDWPHALWVALLVPAWLWGEWSEEIGRSANLWRNAAPIVGTVLLSFAYLSAPTKEDDAVWRRALGRIGAIALIPACILLGDASNAWLSGPSANLPPFGTGDVLAWLVALGLPFAVAMLIRGKQALFLVAILFWCLITVQFHWGHAMGDLGLYTLYGIGAIALAAWGVEEQRPEIVNLGVLSFALTTLAFYFSDLMDKLGRSFSLIVGGLVLLVGGWLLERFRRYLIAGIQGERI